MSPTATKSTGPVLALLAAPRPSPPPLLSPLQSFLDGSFSPPKTHILSLNDYLQPSSSLPAYETGAYDLPALTAKLDELLSGPSEVDGKNILILLYGTAPLFLLDLPFPAAIKIWQDVAADVSLSRAVLADEKNMNEVLTRWVVEKEGWEMAQGEARKKADLIVPEGEGKGVEVVGGAVLDEIISRQVGGEKKTSTIIVGRGDAQEMAYYDTV